MPSIHATLPWRHRFIARYLRAREHPGRLRVIGWIKRLFQLQALQMEVSPGVVMELDEHDYIQREIIFRGSYEPLTLALFERLLGKAHGFLDIGAHHGQYSLRAARALQGRGRVFAVEPTPQNARALLRNAQLSGLDNLDVCTVALSDTPAIMPLLQPSTVNSGQSRLSVAAVSEGTTVHVAVRPFGDLLPLIPKAAFDLVKIDVEGFEARVLASLFGCGAPRPTHIIAEYCEGQFDYGVEGGLRAYLQREGYLVRDVTGRPWAPSAMLPEDNLWAELASPNRPA